MYSRGKSEEVTGRLLREIRQARRLRACHQGLLPGGERREPIRALPEARARRLRRLPQAAGDGLHRPLPDPPLGPGDAGRGGALRTRLARPRGEGPLPRSEQHGRLGVCPRPLARRQEGPPPLRLDAEPLQPRLPRGGEGDDPALHRGRGGPRALEPARPRLPGGEPVPRRGEGDGARPRGRLRGQDVLPARGLRRAGRRARGGPPAGAEARAGGARLAPRPARGSAPPSSGRARSPTSTTSRRRSPFA